MNNPFTNPLSSTDYNQLIHDINQPQDSLSLLSDHHTALFDTLSTLSADKKDTFLSNLITDAEAHTESDNSILIMQNIDTVAFRIGVRNYLASLFVRKDTETGDNITTAA